MMLIYGMPAYQMGMGADDVPDVEVAKAALARMKRSLSDWLRFRARNDAAAEGKVKAKFPPGTVRVMLSQSRDWAGEQKLANQLHALLSEVFDARELPDPDVKKDPAAAVKLAEIAIAGKLPDEANAPSDTGFIWLWPMVIVGGLIAFTITSYVQTQADLQKEKERLECIKVGACTDWGFWVKAAAVGVIGWLVWDRMGVGDRVKGALKGKK